MSSEPAVGRGSSGSSEALVLEGLETRDIGPSGSTASGDRITPELDLRIGRYLVIDELGHGGMGRVLRAYDPKLQREVALKVLRAEAVIPLGRDRMVREARTMAKLSHPNVVAVYDVDDDPQHGIVLAMELVKGSSLKQWLHVRPRSWREILAVFLAAGRGLAAAHDAGLLHRDFKPSNVIVGDDCDRVMDGRGTLKVVDFGLAKHERDRDTGASDTGLHVGLSDEAITQVGSVLGTPRYMAPEQHRGEPLTSAVDQYAFCVAVWEALVGALPFDEAIPISSKLRGPPSWPRPPSVPSAVGEVLRRGLEPAATDRWPGMHALMDALSAAGSRRRWLLPLGAGGALALGVATWQGSDYVDRQRTQAQLERCAAAAATIDAVWNDAARARVASGLRATDVSYAAITADAVIPWLDRGADAWREASNEACLNASLHATWDTDTFDRSQWCLEDRRLELASIVEQLAGADAETTAKAIDAVAGLGSAAPCTDREALASLPAPPLEAERAAISSVRETLARARALQAAGAVGRALTVAQAAQEQAQALTWLPLRARALVLVGALLESTGEYGEAERVSIEAFERAIEGNAWSVAHDAAINLVYTVGVAQARPAEGRVWAGLAEASSAHLSDPLGLLEASRTSARGAMAASAGSYAEAQALFEHRVALEEAAHGPDHPRLAEALANLATLHVQIEAHQYAIPILERALAAAEPVRGADHPFVVFLMSTLAVSHQGAGAHARATAMFEQVLRVQERTLGPEHLEVAMTLVNYSSALMSLGERDRGVAALERALAIRTAKLRPSHPDVAAALNNLAFVYRSEGDVAKARPMFERALEIFEASLGPEHPHTAVTMVNVAAVIDDRDRARSLLERAVAAQERAFGPHHPTIAETLLDLAGVLASADPLASIAYGDRALAVLEGADGDPVALASAQHDVARMLWDAPDGRGRDRTRAMALMQGARAALETRQDAASERAEVEAWLETHVAEPSGGHR